MEPITKVCYEGGPFDGEEELRELRPDQTTIDVLIPPSLNQDLRFGLYKLTETHEGLAVFRWQY